MYTDYLRVLIYSLNKNQRERFKNLLIEFDKEGVVKNHYDSENFSISGIISDIDSTTEFEEIRKRANEAAERGDTTIPQDDWGVHETHCCSKHGCKYGDVDCPVAIGLTTGIRCEDCDYDEREIRGYFCVVCHENPVDAFGGYDTCESCIKKI
jgi:hypothetical protein